MGKMFNLWINLCLFTNHSLRQPVMLKDAASLQPLSEASQLLPNQPPRIHPCCCAAKLVML